MWPGLIVRSSGQAKKAKKAKKAKNAENAGLGVFATTDIDAGMKIPVFGVPLTHEGVEKLKGCEQDTHIMRQPRGRRRLPGGYIAVDGRPGNAPYNGVGGRGLFIAMMINEPSRKKPNCIIMGQFVQLAQNLRLGDELTVSYGESYRRIGYVPSRYCKQKCSYPQLKKFAR